MAQSALSEIPPQMLFSEEDARLIGKHRERLLDLTEKIVAVTTETFLNHPLTFSVIDRVGENAWRETIKVWWREILEGPFDEAFWGHQAHRVLEHIRQGFTNPMLLTLTQLTLNTVRDALGHVENGILVRAVERFLMTLLAVKIRVYEGIHWKAVAYMTGQNLKLLQRNVYLALEEWQSKGEEP